MALPIYFITYLPSWIAGMGLAGILLSVVGSTAGLALGVGTMFANDFGREHFRIDERSVLLITRVAVAAFAGLAVTIALANLDSFLLDWNYLSLALRGAGVFLPLTLAIVRPGRLGASWAVTSMAASTALAIAGRVVFALPVNPAVHRARRQRRRHRRRRSGRHPGAAPGQRGVGPAAALMLLDLHRLSGATLSPCPAAVLERADGHPASHHPGRLRRRLRDRRRRHAGGRRGGDLGALPGLFRQYRPHLRRRLVRGHRQQGSRHRADEPRDHHSVGDGHRRPDLRHHRLRAPTPQRTRRRRSPAASTSRRPDRLTSPTPWRARSCRRRPRSPNIAASPGRLRR